jgi:hypothetical protein
MPDISLPEIHLPDLKLPEGFRDMNRKDIQSAISDRVPKRVELPDVDLSKVELPKAVEERLNKVEKAISRMDLPKVVEDRLPKRKRSNPILPLAAILAVGSMFAAAWWMITSPDAGLRVRTGVDRLRYKLTGQGTSVQPYDDEQDLGSLVRSDEDSRPSVATETWPDAASDLGETVAAGDGLGSSR